MKKIVKGNDFTLKIPVMKMVEGQPQAFPLPACTDVVVQVCNQFRRIPLAFTIDVKEDNVLIARVEGDRMGIGTYAIEVKGKIFGNDWRSNEYPQFAIVSKNADADTEFGETDDGDNSVEMDTAMVILPPTVELSDLIDKTNEALKNNKETNDTINANEEARKKEEESRVIAEQKRTDAEQSRVEAEEARVTAEDERTNAETSRVNAESDRVRAEDTRAEIEVTRQSNELTRKDNEVKRVAAESERVKSEEARVADEIERAKSEEARVADESSRVDAEAQRVSAEVQRVSTENERANAEQDRVAAEDDRVAAETQRETDFATSKKACDDATDKALSTYSHPPYVDADGYYYKWNVSTGSYDKTDVNLTGKAFQIKKVFSSVSAMNATDVNTFADNDFILINTANVEDEDNAKLYVVALNEQGQKFYSYLVDMSGFRGFTGKTPQFLIGNVTTLAENADADASISASGTDTDGNPIYKLNLGIPRGIRLRFADLTDSDKAELMKPATDAAAESRTQTEACKTATDNANAATENANTAATDATDAAAESRTQTEACKTATDNANAATENANTAATDATDAAAESRTQTDIAKELNEHPQKQGDNGNWWNWNVNTHAYEDTGIMARGATMYPIFRHVGNKLYIKWTMEEPQMNK